MTTESAAYRTPTDRDPTPDLDAFIEAYEADDNEWWAIACGHHQNLFEAAIDRVAAVRTLHASSLDARGVVRYDRDLAKSVPYCCECGQNYPCRTVEALTDAE